MKCHRCGREITEDEAYAHQEQVYCDDCLMEIGLHAGRCEPWASYLAGKERAGKSGAEGLTELQKKVYRFIKDGGKTTRDEIKTTLSLSEEELDAQLSPLMHSELVKERGEAGSLFLVAVA
ncbi:MAG: hypothetical protein V3R92_05305 [Dehalococcoidales bacterium]